MEKIEDKTKVSIAYVLLEKGGRILEEIPATHPFVYIHGYNNIIPGLETALAGASSAKSSASTSLRTSVTAPTAKTLS